MHFEDDPISDMHAKNHLIILCLKHFPGPTKFGPVFWSRLFRRGPVEYNYPQKTSTGIRLRTKKLYQGITRNVKMLENTSSLLLVLVLFRFRLGTILCNNTIVCLQW